MVVRSLSCRVKAGVERTSLALSCGLSWSSVFAQPQRHIFLDGASKKKFPNLSEPNAACIAVAPSQRSPLRLIPIKQEAR